MELAEERCDAADLYYQTGENRSVEFENNKLKQITSNQSCGVGLRVIVNGRIGFASTTDFRRPERIVDMAIESAGFGEKAVFEMPKPSNPSSEVKTNDPRVAEIPLEELVNMGKEGLSQSREANSDYLFNAGLSTSHGASRLLNTEGLDIESEGSMMSAGIEIEDMNDNGILDVHEYKSWSRPFDGLLDLTEQALEKMAHGSTLTEAPSERIPMIFTPKTAGNLLSPVLSALNGKLVQKGASLLAGKIGEKVIDERLSIHDAPHIDWAPGSAPFDDEGLLTGRMPLIENGMVKNYFLDLQTAGLLKMPATANGGRSCSSRPSPSSSNIVLNAGTTPYPEMVKDVKCGIIIDQTLGSGQSNTLAGEFSVNVALGFLVKDGKIAGRVKDCMVAGNVYDILSQIEAVGLERRWLGSSCLPAIRIGGLRLAADV